MSVGFACRRPSCWRQCVAPLPQSGGRSSSYKQPCFRRPRRADVGVVEREPLGGWARTATAHGLSSCPEHHSRPMSGARRWTTRSSPWRARRGSYEVPYCSCSRTDPTVGCDRGSVGDGIGRFVAGSTPRSLRAALPRLRRVAQRTSMSSSPRATSQTSVRSTLIASARHQSYATLARPSETWTSQVTWLMPVPAALTPQSRSSLWTGLWSRWHWSALPVRFSRMA